MNIYADNYVRLSNETAAVTFIKKDGTIRNMLCTRNLRTIGMLFGDRAGLLSGHDKRCNIDNGNIAIFDLILEDARSFNINRVIKIQYVGEITTKEQYEFVLKNFIEFRDKYEEHYGKTTLKMNLGDDKE